MRIVSNLLAGSYGDNMTIRRWDRLVDLASSNLLQVQKDKGMAHLGSFIYVVKEETKDDWGYYSKKWHRRHGPKKIVSNRRVEMYERNPLNPDIGVMIAQVPLKSFRGNYLIKAVNELEDAFSTGLMRTSRELLMSETAHMTV